MRTVSKLAMEALWLRVLLFLLFIYTFNCDYIPKWSCDFENGLCHWLQAIDDEKDFRYVSGHDVGWMDHTKNSNDGKFLYLRFKDYYANEEVTAKLMSPVLMPNNGSCKMVLHYKIFKSFSFDKVQVFVNMISKGSSGRIQRKPLFQSDGSTAWKRQDVILHSRFEFQVEIIGVINTHYHGQIGIDDIWFTVACQTNEKSPIRLVKLWSSPSHNYPAGVFYENLNGSWSAICSETRARSACNLLGLKDVMIGNYSSFNGNLISGQGICLPNNITVPTSKVCNNESSCRNVTYWECKQDYISICPKLTHIACTSAVKYPVCVSYNQICDYQNDCPGGEDESDCLAYNRCDFQKDMCDWMAAKHSLYEWKRYYDHVLRQYCLNVGSSHGHQMGSNAKLRLKYLIQGKQNATCIIRFKYRTEGVMRMMLKEKIKNETIWTVTSTGSQWRRAFVELPQNKWFQLYFEGFVDDAVNTNEHFGLASVSFSKDCEFSNYTHHYSRNDSSIFICHSGEAVAKTVVCDLKIDCYDGSDESNCSYVSDRCDFESSFCSWQVGGDSPEKLRRRKGRTPSYLTGPSIDHTDKLKSGYYVYLEATNVKSGAFGYLISKQMQRSVTNKCTFRWFYHMWSRYSYGMGKLSIIYKDLENQSERTIWQVQGNQGSVWKFGSVTFDITSFLYKIVFKAERGASYTSDIALDDVSFAPECLHAQNFQPIYITKYASCSSVKYNVNGSSASLYQFGSGGVFCDVTIRTDLRLRINLYAEFFNTDSSKFVLINAGSNGSVSYGGNFSGSLRPFSLISSSNIMHIRVPPLTGIGSHAFTFNITSTDQPGHPPIYYRPSGQVRIFAVRDCGSGLTRYKFYSSGTVRSRKSYSGYYYNNERCIFKFVASNGYRIKFTFTSFDTEYKYDYVEVLNNGIIGKNRFTGSYNHIQFVSKRSHVEILFSTDVSIRKRGFSLSVMATDEKASAVASFNVPTMHPWLSSTPYQRRTTQQWQTRTFYSLFPSSPSRYLIEKCTHYTLTPQFVSGDYAFGKIYFGGKRQSFRGYVSNHCSWSGYGISYSKYLLEFRYIHTGSQSNALKVNYEAGKSSVFRGYINTRKITLFEASNDFSISIDNVTGYPAEIQMYYSRNPGCYSDSLAFHYAYSHKAHSECYCERFKYGFLVKNASCYCGNHPPAYYGFYMLHPSLCSSCFRSSCSSGELFAHTSKYNEWLERQEAMKEKNKTETVVISTVTISFFLSMVIVYMAYIYYRKRCQRPRCTNDTISAPGNQTGNQENGNLFAHYVNSSPIERMLPSYDDAVKDRVFFFNALQDQNNAQRCFGDAPPSFDETLQGDANDRPPQYDEISVIWNQARAESTGFAPGLINDGSGLMVALPDVESADRPLSREGRLTSHGDSRDSSFQSVASLRSNFSERSGRPLIVAPVSNSEREGRSAFQDNESSLEGRRSQESRRMDQGDISVRRNRNRAADLPPIRRVRAYDNRGADSGE